MQNIVNSYQELSQLFMKIWAHFAEEEKFFLFDHASNTYYLGIKRKNIQNTLLVDEPYAFYPFEFFSENVKNSETSLAIYFEYYFVVKNKKIVFNSLPLAFSKTNLLEKIILTSQEIQIEPVSYPDDYENWKTFFDAIQEKIDTQNLTKVVASRKIEFRVDKKIDTVSMLLKLFKNNPHTYIFASHLENVTFLGASPELLVRKKSSKVTSFAIAGTISKNDANKDEQGKKLLQDEKNNFEHAIVAQSIQNSMEQMLLKCQIRETSQVVKRSETSLLELKNLFHLKTMLTVEDSMHSLLDYVRALHPTPAMGGMPKDLALLIIREYEKYDRKFYAAPFGIVERNGDGIFIVGIRSALIQENKLFAYGGCGIVAQSRCLEEYEEINNKLQTILESL